MAKFDLYGHIRASIKARFWKFPAYNETKMKARVEKPKFKKDGTLAATPEVRYRCAICAGLFAGHLVQIDHIDPVIDPVKGREDILTLIKRQFTDKLQVLCQPCHKAKSAEERKIAAIHNKRRKKERGD